MPQLTTILAALDVPVVDDGLLQTALTHRSFVHEHWSAELQSNERLEFLGDSILNYLAARYLFNAMPDADEGHLTAMRSALVRTTTLARWARVIGLGTHLKLGKGEERSGGRERDPLLADAFEALLAAIALSNSQVVVEQFLTHFLPAEMQQIVAGGLLQDSKSRLQERMQGERNATPHYVTSKLEGPDHERRVTVEVWLGDERLGVGEGSSKQSAAQAAARAALVSLDAAGGKPKV